MKPIVNIYRLARTPYIKALNIQNVLFKNLKRIVSSPCGHNDTRLKDNISHHDSVKETIQLILDSATLAEPANQIPHQDIHLSVSNSLVLVEHEPVYTVGLRARSYNQDYVMRLRSRLAEKNLKADFVNTNRGGLITFHGPGQLVAYPILYLGDFSSTIVNKSVRIFVKKLEDTIIETLSKVGVEGAHTVREYPGVWLAGGERKIAFVGIACNRHVTMHGISINCDCDLSWFDHIISCGIEDKSITSVQHELLSTGKLVEGHTTNDGKSDSPMNQDEDFVFSRDKLSSVNIKQSITQVPDDISPRFGVRLVANAFCSSFSHHFDCDLLER